MARNLLRETTITHAFAHFPDGPFDAIHSEEIRPVFESLPADQQEWVRETVLRFPARDGSVTAARAEALGVAESVGIGLMVLLHPDA